MGKHENAVVKECERVLQLAGIPHFRNNSGAQVKEATATTARRFFSYGAKGWPDIIGIMPGGRMLGVECKAKGGKQTESQVAIAETFARCGALYILCYDAVTLVQNLKAEGIRW